MDQRNSNQTGRLKSRAQREIRPSGKWLAELEMEMDERGRTMARWRWTEMKHLKGEGKEGQGFAGQNGKKDIVQMEAQLAASRPPAREPVAR